MSNNKPEPRIDRDGTPWCGRACPNLNDKSNNQPICSILLNDGLAGICEPGTRIMAAEIKRLRCALNSLIGYAQTVRFDQRRVLDEDCTMLEQTESWCKGLVEAAAQAAEGETG